MATKKMSERMLEASEMLKAAEQAEQKEAQVDTQDNGNTTENKLTKQDVAALDNAQAISFDANPGGTTATITAERTVTVKGFTVAARHEVTVRAWTQEGKQAERYTLGDYDEVLKTVIGQLREGDVVTLDWTMPGQLKLRIDRKLIIKGKEMAWKQQAYIIAVS